MVWSYLVAILFVIFQHCALEAKELYLVPHGRSAFGHGKYLFLPTIAPENLSTWQMIDRALRASGDNLKTSNLSELSSSRSSSRIGSELKYIIFVNLPKWTGKDWKKKLAYIPKKKRVIIALEPPSVQPEMYKYFSQCGKVLTWDDDLIDNKKFFKMHYPVLRPMDSNLPSFSGKKLCTQISCNKKSAHPDELYTARQRVITYFERHGGNDFEFYGRGWAYSGFRNYRGEIANKHEMLKKYRFSFCYENIKNIKGYVTEKIFDCFAAGVVPVYLGASNIKEYVPSNCFISPADFSSMDALVAYLKNMPEKKYNQYLANIRRYLKSDKAQKFSKKAFADTVIFCLSS